MKTKSIFVTLLLPLFFFQCGKEKTEREQYEDMCSSLKYMSYKPVSGTVLPMSVKEYNAQRPKDSIVEVNTIRLLLGYQWAVTGQAPFAFAEADLVTENTKDISPVFLARSFRSIVMYEQGWEGIAKEESEAAMKMDTSQNKEDLYMQAMAFHLIMGTLFVKEKKFDNAAFHFAGFGQITGIKWPYLLCDAMAEFQKGNQQAGLQKLKKMSQDPAVPAELRTILADQIGQIEKENGSVDSAMFWPRAISNIILKELANSAQGEMKELMKMINELSQKIPV